VVHEIIPATLAVMRIHILAEEKIDASLQVDALDSEKVLDLVRVILDEHQ
jgi:hypothetical protein